MHNLRRSSAQIWRNMSHENNEHLMFSKNIFLNYAICIGKKYLVKKRNNSMTFSPLYLISFNN